VWVQHRQAAWVSLTVIGRCKEKALDHQHHAHCVGGGISPRDTRDDLILGTRLEVIYRQNAVWPKEMLLNQDRQLLVLHLSRDETHEVHYFGPVWRDAIGERVRGV
jgi:hypothetical protein